jgi:Zn ribbon nucleic-acid-binding protein
MFTKVKQWFKSTQFYRTVDSGIREDIRLAIRAVCDYQGIDPKCPKCGTCDTISRFHEQGMFNGAVTHFFGHPPIPHLDQLCVVCGHKWWERTADDPITTSDNPDLLREEEISRTIELLSFGPALDKPITGE